MKKDKRWMILSLIAAVSVYGEENQPSEPNNSSADSKSAFESVVESIAEAAINNPDYGKDISDR